MDRQNWYFEELVDVNNMTAIESSAQNGIKDILVSEQNKGVINGFAVTQTTPVPSLAILIAAGKIALEDGSIVVMAAPRTLDMSGKLPPGVGSSWWVSIYACPIQSSDTPVVIPAGATINYHLFDDVQFITVTGVAGFGSAAFSTVPPAGFVGTLIGDVFLTNGQTQIINANFSVGRAVQFALLGKIQAEIDLINNHVVLPFTPVLVFDWSLSHSYEVTLTSDTTAVSSINVPLGIALHLYVKQDATGTRNFLNPGLPMDVIKPDANSWSWQSFKKLSDGTVLALTPLSTT